MRNGQRAARLRHRFRTGLLRNQNRTQQDWTADYRFYSEDHFDEDRVFDRIRAQIEQDFPSKDPLVVAMDDSLLRKTGPRIFGSRFQRDPLSPPFQVNFVRGLRVLQISAAVPLGSQGAARMIPVDFQHAALPAKPRKDAAPERWAVYREQRAKMNINVAGRNRLTHMRRQMDQSGSSQRPLIATLDGRFTNGTVLEQIPERTTLIGRVRKDSAFYFPPPEQAPRGRKRKYGAHCPTPEQLLKDPAQPWQTVEAFAAGKRYPFRVKTLAPVYSQSQFRHTVSSGPLGYRSYPYDAFRLVSDRDASRARLRDFALIPRPGSANWCQNGEKLVPGMVTELSNHASGLVGRDENWCFGRILGAPMGGASRCYARSCNERRAGPVPHQS